MSRSLPLCSRWLPTSVNIARALDTVKRYTASAPVQVPTYGQRLAGQLHRTCVEEEVAPSCLWVSSCPPSRPQHTKRPGLRFRVSLSEYARGTPPALELVCQYPAAVPSYLLGETPHALADWFYSGLPQELRRRRGFVPFTRSPSPGI